MPRLIAQSEEFVGKIFELESPKVTVGRRPDNTISLPHNSISGHHAELILEGLDYKLIDLDSTNGTRVDGEKVSEYKLRRNNIVRFGNIELMYDSEHAPDYLAMPEPSEGINLGECRSAGRPAGFVNSSPMPKHKPKTTSPWILIYSILGLICAGSVGFMFWQLVNISY